ncbi:MAG: hypothetical protein PUC36_01335 [Clostridiales bacterium]|nr:hypothetical protein [Clostridiales bacterium]
MDLEELDPRYVPYGALSVLDNRLRACQNSAYPDMTMKQHFLLVSVNLFGDDFPTLKQAGDLLGCSYQNVKRPLPASWRQRATCAFWRTRRVSGSCVWFPPRNFRNWMPGKTIWRNSSWIGCTPMFRRRI